MGIESSLPDNIGNRLEDAPVESIYNVGFEGDGRTLKPGATLGTGMFEDDVVTQADEQGLLQGLTPIQSTRSFSSTKSCEKNGKAVHDQIEESMVAQKLEMLY